MFVCEYVQARTHTYAYLSVKYVHYISYRIGYDEAHGIMALKNNTKQLGEKYQNELVFNIMFDFIYTHARYSPLLTKYVGLV